MEMSKHASDLLFFCFLIFQMSRFSILIDVFSLNSNSVFDLQKAHKKVACDLTREIEFLCHPNLRRQVMQLDTLSDQNEIQNEI